MKASQKVITPSISQWTKKGSTMLRIWQKMRRYPCQPYKRSISQIRNSKRSRVSFFSYLFVNRVRSSEATICWQVMPSFWKTEYNFGLFIYISLSTEWNKLRIPIPDLRSLMWKYSGKYSLLKNNIRASESWSLSRVSIKNWVIKFIPWKYPVPSSVRSTKLVSISFSLTLSSGSEVVLGTSTLIIRVLSGFSLISDALFILIF